MIYLDNSATTRPFDEVIHAVNACMSTDYFNPASAYAPAVEVERKLESHRAQFAQAMGVRANEIVFTSGATEGNNTAIFSTLSANRQKGRLITTSVEHPSVHEAFLHMQKQGYDVVFADVDLSGSVNMDQFADLLTPDTLFVSMMHVNNETGAINDIDRAAQFIRARAPQAVFHVDGVQAFCKLPFTKLPCDLYSISGHKFHAPKGVGALYVKNGLKYTGFIGGGQERGLRSGTSNTPGIIGMGTALAMYRSHQTAFISSMRTCKLRLAENILRIPDTFINGPAPDAGVPHILNASFVGVRGEVLLHTLAQKGMIVSTGSACSSHKKGKNRILCAMGITGERQEGAIRFSFSPMNTAAEMDQTAQAIQEALVLLRKFKRR